MTGEPTEPMISILPCRSIDEQIAFCESIGFNLLGDFPRCLSGRIAAGQDLAVARAEPPIATRLLAMVDSDDASSQARPARIVYRIQTMIAAASVDAQHDIDDEG